MAKEIEKILGFSHFIQGLKLIERFKGHFYWTEYPFPGRYESVADHTWRIAVMLLVVEKYLSQPIDIKKALTMALIHDIPEIIAGDASILGTDGTGKDAHSYNKEAAELKRAREKKAAEEIFSKLPQEIGNEFLDTWVAYERQDSFEARVVNALDKIEAKLQVFEYSKGEVFKNHFEFNQKYGKEATEVDPILKELGELAFKELADNYKEFKK